MTQNLSLYSQETFLNKLLRCIMVVVFILLAMHMMGRVN